jgi:SAM-dependent methyltransferase
MSSTPFQTPADWEPIYAANPKSYTFGDEPSQLARTALRFFETFDGDPYAARALDLGCGEGRDTAFLAAAGLQVTARDVAPTGLVKLTALLARDGTPVGRVDVALGDVREFAYPHDAYDLALAANVYQFLTPEEGPAHISQLKQSTKPGGICAVGVFSPAMLAWGALVGDRYLATADDLAAFFTRESGWLLLDRTEYWTYRRQEDTMASFAYVVARRLPSPSVPLPGG